jgi:hypothetical protein
VNPTAFIGLVLLCLVIAGFLLLRMLRALHRRLDILERIQRRKLEESIARHPAGRHRQTRRTA